MQLQESPYLIHPVENNTVGLYKEPVCVLDFASLYPSLFRAYNLSYDTLLHDKDDAKLLGDDQVFVTPTGGFHSTWEGHFCLSSLTHGDSPDLGILDADL